MEHRRLLVLLVVLVVSLSLTAWVWHRRGSQEPPFYLGGIQVNEASLPHWLDRLEAVGMNTVSVTDYAHHGDWDSYNLWYDEEAEGELAEMRAAKGRGMHVVLIARVALDHAFPRNEFLWHGMILPKSEEELDEWFRRYTAFVLRWAEIAQREGVDVLMIGSEMNALTSTLPLTELPPLHDWYLSEEKRREQKEALLAHGDVVERRHLAPRGREGYDSLESYLEAQIGTERSWAETTVPSLAAANARRADLDRRWRELIARVREVYDGPLGYAANFDQYQEVGFWDALDVMGINAYFQLRPELLPQRDAETLQPLLVEGWRGVLGGIAEVRREQGLEDMPVVFTEMGYTYRANSTLEPWAADGFSLLPVAEAAPSSKAAPDAAPDAEPDRRLVVWQDQPVDLTERALAVRALRQAHAELQDPFLAGILYWKLSTEPAHFDVEPFVLLIDEGREDPLLPELQAFAAGS